MATESYLRIIPSEQVYSQEPEEWRRIPGHGDRYIVSSWGRVAKLLQGYIGKAGYRVVCLSHIKRPVLLGVHQVVMRVFRGPANGMWLHHRDNDKVHNDLRNLEYLTPKENTIRAFDDGLNFRCEDKVEAKLTNEQVRQIRDLCSAGILSQREIGERYGVKQGTISGIHIGKTWRGIL